MLTAHMAHHIPRMAYFSASVGLSIRRVPGNAVWAKLGSAPVQTAWGHTAALALIYSVLRGSRDNASEKLRVRDAHRRWTGAMPTSENIPSETVWKIALGYSRVRCWRREPADPLLYWCFRNPSAA
jgi:hypothetical protein